MEEQNCTLWNRDQIAEGLALVERTFSSRRFGPYTLQAAIAAAHAEAPNAAATDWAQIAVLYGLLAQAEPSPVVELNRAVAVANVHGPAAGLEAVAAIQNLQPLDSYYLLYAVLGEFEEQLKHFDTAAEHFRKALEFTKLRSEQSFLSRRVHDCEAQLTERTPIQLIA